MLFGIALADRFTSRFQAPPTTIDPGSVTITINKIPGGLEVVMSGRLRSSTPVTDIIRFRQIPAGTCLIGSPDTEKHRFDDEGPQMYYDVEARLMADTELTWAQRSYFDDTDYNGRRALNSLGYQPVGAAASLPAFFGTIYEARRACEQLTTLSRRAIPGWPPNARFRLPTEVEWEHACRAGTTTRYGFGDDPDYRILSAFAQCSKSGGPALVGLLAPNLWGLHDMHGNLQEWCERKAAIATGLTGQEDFSTHGILRGGSWADSGPTCRSAFRRTETPAPGTAGIRLVLEGFSK